MEFAHLILIPTGNYQTLSTNDVNTTSAHGFENSKPSNDYQVNSVRGVYPSRRDK